MPFVFSDYSLDAGRRELRRGSALVELEPQVFDLLIYLIENRDRVVSKDDLIASVWHGRIVSESTLTSRITAARKAIGDSGERQVLIRTMARKGIRFTGDVSERAALKEPTTPLTTAPPTGQSAPRDALANAAARRSTYPAARGALLYVVGRHSDRLCGGRTRFAHAGDQERLIPLILR